MRQMFPYIDTVKRAQKRTLNSTGGVSERHFCWRRKAPPNNVAQADKAH